MCQRFAPPKNVGVAPTMRPILLNSTQLDIYVVYAVFHFYDSKSKCVPMSRRTPSQLYFVLDAECTVCDHDIESVQH